MDMKKLNYIDSKYTRKMYEEIGFELTDFKKATLIWNKEGLLYEEKLLALSDLCKETKDMILKRQIKERLDYEKKIWRRFKERNGQEFVYVVRNCESEDVCGIFLRYRTALMQAKMVALEKDTDTAVEKHLVVKGERIPFVRKSLMFNPNLFPGSSDTIEKYDGSPVARLYVNKKGEIDSFWSDELPGEEKKVSEFGKTRFEYAFINVPYIHHKGMPVRNIVTGEYGVLSTDKADWSLFLDKVKNGMYVDYSDVVHTVYCLTEKGYWFHDHWNPMEIEPGSPSVSEFADKRSGAYALALSALGCYLAGKNDEKQIQMVLQTTREYSNLCKCLSDLEKISRQAKSVEDILF